MNGNTRAFGGSEDPLSNHFPCDFTHNHIKGKSTEHVWMHQKALKNGQSELAHMCLDAETAKDAKYLSEGIRCTPDWDRHELSYNLMKDINRSKYQQVKVANEQTFSRQCLAEHLFTLSSVTGSSHVTYERSS